MNILSLCDPYAAQRSVPDRRYNVVVCRKYSVKLIGNRQIHLFFGGVGNLYAATADKIDIHSVYIAVGMHKEKDNEIKSAPDAIYIMRSRPSGDIGFDIRRPP